MLSLASCLCVLKAVKASRCVALRAAQEADVELYLNHTGLMWETAPEFGALLVFAEHRYYGKVTLSGKQYARSCTCKGSTCSLFVPRCAKLLLRA